MPRGGCKALHSFFGGNSTIKSKADVASEALLEIAKKDALPSHHDQNVRAKQKIEARCRTAR